MHEPVEKYWFTYYSVVGGLYAACAALLVCSVKVFNIAAKAWRARGAAAVLPSCVMGCLLCLAMGIGVGLTVNYYNGLYSMNLTDVGVEWRSFGKKEVIPWNEVKRIEVYKDIKGRPMFRIVGSRQQFTMEGSLVKNLKKVVYGMEERSGHQASGRELLTDDW